ncbi:MAG: DNA primase [Pseudomonadota bacterium]
MRFGEAFLEDLKSRIRPSDVIGRHVKLRRQGREFAGLSPFTNEKTPSFFVNDQKGFYHCFSSGKHGDAISFLMEVQGLSFPEAVEQLAGLAGMELPRSDPKAEERARERKAAISWMERAQDHFEKTLYRAPGEAAREYLKGRGLTQTAAKHFGLGFAEDSFSALKDNLIREGAEERQLIEAGLLIDPEDSNPNRQRASWDRFRNRIMFPIHDTRGRLVAFGGRAMDPDAKAKYLNSPETRLFSKGQLLYNYHRARKALADPKNPARGMIVVEGYMDVIALSRAGFPHAVAPMGTALTEDQLGLLWRAGPDGYLCFDGDTAGLRAAYRSIERALPLLRPGQSLRFVLMPEGQDPDDLIRAHGAPAFGALLERSVPLVDMLWRREVEREALNTPEAKAGLKSRLYDALGEIADGTVREQYKTALLDRFDKRFGRQWTPNRAKPREKKADKAVIAAGAARLARNSRQAQTLIGGILLFPELLGEVDETFFGLEFDDPGHAALQRATLRHWRQSKAVDIAGLHAHMSEDGLEEELRTILSRRALITAALGGAEAETGDRAAIWMSEAGTFLDNARDDATSPDARVRMAEAVRKDNAEAMHRLMRAQARTRD